MTCTSFTYPVYSAASVWSLSVAILVLAGKGASRGSSIAALLLVVIRPLSVFLTLPRLPKTQRRIVAWFGIRGIGSLFYLALVRDSGLQADLATALVNATLPAIALSVLLHGVSATPLMALYRKRRVLQERDKRRTERRRRDARS